MQLRRHLILAGWAALGVLVLVAIVQSTGTTLNNWQTFRSESEFSVWKSRLEPIRADLPEQLTYMGYFAESDLPGQGAVKDDDAEYRLSQYILAPVVVERGLGHRWILVNLSERSENTGTRYLKDQGLKQAASYANGLYLFYDPRISP